MANLTSYRPGAGAFFPETLRERLRSFPVFEDAGEGALKEIFAAADWFSLPGGTQLSRQGDDAHAVFIVITGTFGVFVEDENSPARLVGYVRAGETLGENTALTGDMPVATLVALRDTELLRLGAREFDALLMRHPHVMFNLLKQMARRLRQSARRSSTQMRPKTFAIVPLQEGLENELIGRDIAGALVRMGAKVGTLDVVAEEQPTEWFNRFELEHDVVFYRGDKPDSSWTHFCLRQADRVMLMARADESLPLHPYAQHFFKRGMNTPPELLLVHPGGGGHSLPQHIELRSDLYSTHHHIREGNAEDIKRLARFVAGRAVSLVLAGGGARGIAHIGVLRALKEAGVPFDFVGGTSMGGIIGAGLAMEWSIDEISERMYDSFVANNPLSDYTLPLIALFRGAKVSALLQRNFGDTRIEDLVLPYFCVSSDLTSGSDYVHRSGPVWRALRASVALPGILPPVALGSHLLVDGGVMNNLPVDVMAGQARGPIIAVDVAGAVDLHVDDQRYGERSLWSLIAQRMRGTPSIISILMRTGTVGSDMQRRVAREQADFLFEPPLNGIGMGDWKAFHQCVAQGYAHAVLMIEKHGVPLSDTWSDGPALSLTHSVGA